MTREESILKAQEAFGNLIREDYKRIDRMKQAQEPVNFEKLDKTYVGILPGDGIGPVIMPLALKVMEALVGDEIKNGKIEIRHIEGMTIENRVAKLNSLPEECLEEIRKCQVLLKGPMVTPRAGDGLPNLVSANSLLRRGLDLYAAVRPIDIPERGIHWTFFRENVEGEYIWGNKVCPLTAASAISVAAQVPGTVVHELAQGTNAQSVRVGHPSGVMTLFPYLDDGAKPLDEIRVSGVAVQRTARRIMEGTVYIRR